MAARKQTVRLRRLGYQVNKLLKEMETIRKGATIAQRKIIVPNIKLLKKFHTEIKRGCRAYMVFRPDAKGGLKRKRVRRR